LGKVCDPDQVYVTPGTLTGLLRGKWGLNSLLADDNRKDRTDNRHHAIDAIVIVTCH
jgi:CRISPR-associated endonuclease Csn1